MKKFEKYGCVKYASNSAKEAELLNMGFEEVGTKKPKKPVASKNNKKIEEQPPIDNEQMIEGESDGSDPKDSE